MILLEKLYKFLKPFWSYGLFILEIIGWLIIICFLTLSLISVFQVQFPQAQISFSDFVLLITAAFVLAYTYEAKRMRRETVFQRKMSYAIDIRFKMIGYYKGTQPA